MIHTKGTIKYITIIFKYLLDEIDRHIDEKNYLHNKILYLEKKITRKQFEQIKRKYEILKKI